MDITGLIPQFGGFAYNVVAFVIALSVIVAVHEYGHYIVGRWSGIHAEVFSLGFGPVLWSRVDRRGTRWQIAALPFGGFVKFLGDANAASGKDAAVMADAAADPKALRRTMHGAPLWARAATVAAGPFFNFVLSVIIFAAIFMSRGVTSDPLTVGELKPLPDSSYELQSGDQILAINGTPIPEFGVNDDWTAFRIGLKPAPSLDYLVKRDGAEVTVKGPYLYPPVIDTVVPRSAAMDIGLQAGDVIQSVDGTPISSFDELKTRVEASDGRPLQLVVWRDGATQDFALVPRRMDEAQDEGGFATNWRIGVVSSMAFEAAREPANLTTAVQGAVMQMGAMVTTSISGLWHIITGAISTCNLSGPIGIAQASGDTASQGAQSFIWFIASLSTAVGLLNLFPIPALDGGHLVFYAYEAVTGQPPSDLALRVMMSLGLAILLTLMVFALFNDVVC